MVLDSPVGDVVLAPERPRDLPDTGLAPDSILALLLKSLQGGEATGLDVAERIRLPYGILEPLIGHLRAERLVEVKSAAGVGTAGYRYALTGAGHERARRAMEACGYIGPAPVPLAQYTAFMKLLTSRRPPVDAARMAAAFAHLVVEPDMLDQLGPAVGAGRAVFLYGPPGNGKSVMGDGLGRVLGGDIYVPHALDVDGQVVSLFDPVTHEARVQEDDSAIIRTEDAADGRWIRIRRPVIIVGGELTTDMLDLRFNALASFYEAPVQLKANGGVLLVDDFGRQRVPARDLLNRWVVPLESRVDYLTLHTGRKFQVPFEPMVVFATNLDPQSLADEAFLRRIPYKVLARNPSPEQFTRIFELNCRRHGVPFDPAHVAYLQEQYYRGRGLQMRACHPRDLIDQIVSLCRYRRQTVGITTALLEQVCRSYFLENAQPGATAAR